VEEVDNCRPHSDKNWFSLLKESKKKLQLAQINLVSLTECYGKMAKKGKNKPAPGSDEENNSLTEQRKSCSAKKQTNNTQVDKNAPTSARDYVITNAQILAMSPENQDKFIEMYLDGLDTDKKIGIEKHLGAIARIWEKLLVFQFINQSLLKRLPSAHNLSSVVKSYRPTWSAKRKKWITVPSRQSLES
jgi:hypothetical protein